MIEKQNKECLVCNRTDEEIPLLALDYQGKQLYICPQHIPVLIHDPTKLTGTLPGAEGYEPYEE